jgi:uncharacterized protein (TIGR02466 family)
MGDIQVRGLLATPVAALMTPDAEARNQQLEEIILRKRAENPSLGASNIGDWHSTRDFASWSGKHAEDIIALARLVATKLTSDRNGVAVHPDWTCEAWANVNGPGDSNSCHYHPGNFWSGTYDVNDGGCADDPALGGEFEMFDPREPAPMMHAPSLKFGGEDGVSAGSAETIRPRAGLMFLFPAFLLHAVRPYRGAGLRISIAFNFGLYRPL